MRKLAQFNPVMKAQSRTNHATPFNISGPLPEGKRAIKRQLYSGPFTLREAASFIFQY